MTIKKATGRPHAQDPLLQHSIRLTQDQIAFVKSKGAAWLRSVIEKEMKDGFEGAKNEK